MVFWPIVAFMAALAVGLVVRPLLGRRGVAGDRSVYEAAVYRDQLESLERELAGGLIGPADAAAARAEIGRRLLATRNIATGGGAPGAGDGAPRAHRWLAAAVVAFVPVVSVATYLGLGSPGIPSAPYNARFEKGSESAGLDTLVARVERHLRTNPGDAKGWEVIGRPYMRLGRYRDAANAFDRAIKLAGPSARRLSSYGEALVFAANGMVEAQAREAFEKSAALKPDFAEPRYYLGLAAFQTRDFDTAITAWQTMLDTGPADASWRGEVTRQVALAKRSKAGEELSAGPSGRDAGRALPAPSGPGAQDLEAARSMPPEQRRAMIESMVTRLADRLASNGNDIDGWERLVRAYGVLGRNGKAREALERAREIFSADPEKLDRLRAISPG